MLFAPTIGERAFVKLIDIERKDGEGLLREPIALGGRLGDERQDDREEGKEREDGEIKFSQLLLVDLGREQSQRLPVLLVAIDGGAMTLHVGEQMRRSRRRDPLRGEVAADVQVGRILFFFDGLMLLPRLLYFLLLRPAAFLERAIARFELAPDARDVLVRLCDKCFLGGELCFRNAASFRAPQPGLHHLGFFLREPRPFRADPFQLHLQIRRRRLRRPQGRKLFQQVAIGRVVFLDAALDCGQLFVAALGRGFRAVAAFDQRTLLLFELGQGGGLFAGIFLALLLDLLERFLDLCDPDRDFFLLLLELFQRDDFVAHFRKVGRFRGPFATEGDLGFLQDTFLVLQRQARALAPRFQRQLAKSSGDKTHEINYAGLFLDAG